MNYISKLNIVAAEYLTKAGAARRACVTCAIPAQPSTGNGYNYRPVSVRVVSSSGSCNPGPNGQVHSQIPLNPYIGASGTYVAFVDLTSTASSGCEYVTCYTQITPGNPQRNKSFAYPVYATCDWQNQAFIKVPDLRSGPVGQPTGSGVPPFGV
jgi:hypothetical protein